MFEFPRRTKETKTMGKRKKDREFQPKPHRLARVSATSRKGALERFFQKYSKPLLAAIYTKVTGGTEAEWLKSGRWETDHILDRTGSQNCIPNMVTLRNLQFLTHDLHKDKTDGLNGTRNKDWRTIHERMACAITMSRIEEKVGGVYTLKELAFWYEKALKAWRLAKDSEVGPSGANHQSWELPSLEP